MKVYISGKISGLSKEEYMKRFSEAETFLVSKGHSVINPAAVNERLPKDTTYEQYMDMSMTMLSFCQAVYMLNNWKDSQGAKMEHAYAGAHDYIICYED